MIQVQRLTKIYGHKVFGVTALNKVSFEVKKGEILGIVGPNGAGKTTLIKILAGLLLQDEGQVIVNGFDSIHQRESVRNSVNLLRSFGWMVFDYRINIYRNLKFWGVMFGLNPKEADERIDFVLQQFDLADRKFDFPENLSTGMRQKLALARCLLVDRPIYLMDEPTASIDAYSADSIREFIKNKLAKNNHTIILTTHNLWEAEKLCNRIAILDRGRLLEIDTVAQLKKKFGEHYSINEIFLKLMSERHE